MGPATNTRSRYATHSVIWTIVALFLWANYSAPYASWNLRLFSAAACCLCAIPTVSWLKNGSRGFPCFEVLCLSLIPTEAIPILTKTGELPAFEAETITRASLTFLAFVTAMIIAHRVTRGRPAASQFWNSDLVGADVQRALTLAIIFCAACTVCFAYLFSVPRGFQGPLRAITSGVSIVCVYSLSNYWGKGSLTTAQRVALVASIFIQGIVLASGLVMVQAISLIVVAVLGYCSTNTRIPWLPIGAIIAVVAILHAGKSDMRSKYWSEDDRSVHASELPAFYSEWLAAGLGNITKPDESDTDKRDSNTLLQRSSLFHMLCLVVENTPEPLEHLHGATYADIPAQFVPRIFWPDKPSVHESTSRLGIYYGLQDEDATLTTTIGFGYIAEAWANFGILGCISLGVFLGVIHKLAWSASLNASLFSPAGMLMIIFTAWSFETGQTLSVWASSYSQAAIVLLALSLVMRNLCND